MDAERWDWAIGGVALLLRGVLRCVALQRRKETRKETRDLDCCAACDAIGGLARVRGTRVGDVKPVRDGVSSLACCCGGCRVARFCEWQCCGRGRLFCLLISGFVKPSGTFVFAPFFPFFSPAPSLPSFLCAPRVVVLRRSPLHNTARKERNAQCRGSCRCSSTSSSR